MAAGGLDMIRTMLHKLPQSERKLAEYILENPQEIVNSTIQEISGAANTSGAIADPALQIARAKRIPGFKVMNRR